jgi:hypothetical protein
MVAVILMLSSGTRGCPFYCILLLVETWVVFLNLDYWLSEHDHQFFNYVINGEKKTM